jgi:hypothetical protein
MSESTLPPWLQFKRIRRGETARPTDAVPLGGRRLGDGPNNSDGDVALAAPASPATRPRRVGAPAPEQSLEDLGIPADAERLPKVPEVAGVDENYSSSSDPSSLRPRRATSSPGLDEVVSRFNRKFLADPHAPVPVERGELAATVAQQPTLPVPPRLPNHSPGAFEPSRVPVAGKARALPAPGEEAANDARVRARIGAAGGYDDGGDGATATRERITDPAGRLEKQIDYERQHPAKDGNGWWSVLKSSGKLALDGFVRGGVPGAVRGGVTGAVVGAVDKSADERYDQGRRVGRYQQELGDLREKEKGALELEGKRADIGVKEANRDWLRQRPVIEQGKADSAALKRAQDLLQREIGNRLKEPRPFDPADSYDSDLAARAEGLGMRFAPGAFGDFKNPAQLEVIDPTDPSGTRKTRLVYDRDSGGWRPLTVGGQGVTSNYVQPVDSKTGMTPFQTGSLQLSGERLGESKRHNSVTERQGDDRIGISRQNVELSAERNLISWKSYETRRDNFDFQAKRKHYDEARELIEQHNKYRAASERYAGYRDDKGQQPQWARLRQQEQESLADSIRSELESVYGDLYQPGSGQGLAAPPAPPSAMGSASAPSSRKYTADEVRERARAAGKDPEAAVSAARSRGLLKE